MHKDLRCDVDQQIEPLFWGLTDRPLNLLVIRQLRCGVHDDVLNCTRYNVMHNYVLCLMSYILCLKLEMDSQLIEI